jgi:response regulator NasT
VRPAIDVAMATFQRFQTLRGQMVGTGVEFESRALIERAKFVLMREHQVTEEQAYHLLRRTAMNRKPKLADVARDFLTSTGSQNV